MFEMTALDILKGARELLTPETWMKNSLSENTKGDFVEPNSPDACRWCWIGAMRKVTDTWAGQECIPFYGAVAACRSVLPEGCLVQDWNDAHPYDEVMLAIDLAIERLESLKLL